jgi:hypothetical protein
MGTVVRRHGDDLTSRRHGRPETVGARSFQSTSQREVGGLPGGRLRPTRGERRRSTHRAAAAKISGSALGFSQLALVRSGRFRGSARSLPYRDAA